MAHFYSGKKYNVVGLFEEMNVAWGLQSMQLARVLGDNKFMQEFDMDEVRRKLLREVRGDLEVMLCW
jgi:hypothetical protein